MIPSKHISPPEWMRDDRTIRLMKVIGGFEMPAESLFVGGCVRNTLMDKPVQDIDIATIHTPEKIIEKLDRANIRSIPTGIEHGTVTALVDDMTFEITTLRRDVETDGRRAVIAFTQDWREDSNRRDFTINALLASPEGVVFDPTGQGLFDLDIRRVAFVGNAPERIAEDYLRILRFFRFHGQYGECAPDEAALSACHAAADKIKTLSKERITQELMKILALPNALNVLELMFLHSVLKDMEEGFEPSHFQNFCALQERYEAVDVVARLSFLSDIEGWLTLSNAQKRHLARLSRGKEIIKSISKKAVRELVYRVGNESAAQVYFLALSGKGDLPDLDLLDTVKYWQAPTFPVKGEDLIAQGIPQGPEIGKKLKEMEEAWVKGDFPSDFSWA